MKNHNYFCSNGDSDGGGGSDLYLLLFFCPVSHSFVLSIDPRKNLYMVMQKQKSDFLDAYLFICSQ